MVRSGVEGVKVAENSLYFPCPSARENPMDLNTFDISSMVTVIGCLAPSL